MPHAAVVLALLVVLTGAPGQAGELQAGLARVEITPREAVWMSGYASRERPSDGVYQPLWARALALRDPAGRRAVVVATDLIGLPRALSAEVASRVGERFGLERSALVLSASHTHTGPALSGNLVVMAPPEGEERRRIEAYGAWLVERLVEVVGAALGDLAPARLSAGHGSAGFAANRRQPTPAEGVRLGVNPTGPVDHDVPVLKVVAPDGTLRGVLFGYACHNTTLGGDLHEIGGDYAGYAQAALEESHPGAVALYLMLCGGDQNPEPRGTLALARAHGRTLATEVERVLEGPQQPVRPPIRTGFEVADLPYAPHTRAAFEEESASDDVFRRRRAGRMLAAYDAGAPVREEPFPVQAVRLGGDLTLLALGGEPVVDYAHRARRELAGENLIVAGYCNDVPGYLPSRRVLREGGYEPEGSTVYYGQPGPFAASVEEVVFAAVRRVAAEVGVTATPAPPAEERIPAVDERAIRVRDLNTPASFTPFPDADTWRERARFLRERILVSAGLWPLPGKGPLNAEIFGRVERDGYSVEKVYFESHPGFYVTGNLYRPSKGTGPFPAVLSPHGHWAYGRLENSALGSVPARGIALARQGYVVFSYDMVGYDDSRQVDHRLLDPVLSQWGVGSLGLHLWNSIRSLDFLESLPDVDPDRLAATGASGGGTQTFLLTAVDDRVGVSAPVNMVSHYMQGGDVCENAPNLRLDTSNVEIAALAAPRPLLMVSAAGDWTRDTPRIEFPAVRSVYALLGFPERVATVQFVAEHNYNRDSREAVYGWFARWVQGHEDAAPLPEAGYTAEQPSDLLVFHGRELPDGARTQAEITAGLVAARTAQLAALRPRDAEGLARFREVLGTGLRHALAAEDPARDALLEERLDAPGPRHDALVGRRGEGDRVPVSLWPAAADPNGRAVLVVHPEGIRGVAARAETLVAPLREAGWTVASLDAFGTGSAAATRDDADRFFTTYNRTDDALRVQDVVTALAWLEARPGVESVALVGLGRAGLWSLLAQALSPDLAAVAADADGFPTGDDAAYLERIFVPLLRSVGGFETALTLGLGRRLAVHGTGDAFDTAAVEASARAVGAPGLEVHRGRMDDAALVAWLSR